MGYGEIIGLRWSSAPRPPMIAYQRFALAEVANLDSGFLQIPHWLPAAVDPPGVTAGVSSGTLAFAYLFPSPKGHGWTSTS